MNKLMLEPLGLDSLCESIYITVIENPGVSSEYISDKLNRARGEVDSALERLKDLTLLQLRSDDAGIYAISPERGMEILLSVQQAELASFQHRMELSRAAAARLIAEHAKVAPENDTPEVEYLVGIDAIRARLETLSASVVSEVLNFSPTCQSSTDIEAGKEATMRYAGSGVISRSIYQHSALRHAPTADYLDWLVRQGFKIRTTPVLPSRMVIFDREIAILPMSADDSRDGAVVLYGRATVAAFCSLFDWIWDRAISVEPTMEKRDARSVALEMEAVWLLAQGYTDETVAKRLGVSPRTSRRIVESVMQRLGARSRFQAGVFAERNGLLDQSPL